MSEPLRVAQIMGKMVGGGLESVVMNYYRHIDRDQVQFDFVVDSDSTLVPADEIESLGGRVIKVAPYQRQPQNSHELERLFGREKYRIVHSHMNTLSVFPLRAAKRAGVPVRIAHSHSTWGKGELKRNVLKGVLRTQANRYPTHRMACSQYAGEWLFGRGRSFAVLPNAIELDRFEYSPSARNAIRMQMGIARDAFVVGHVGRFVTQKNHEFLVRVFNELQAKRPNSVLLLVGDGPLRPEVEHSIQRLGLADKVRFAGQHEDVERFYSAMDVFCFPSLYEGFGMVVVEAQRSGLPCVVSDRVPENVDVTGTSQFCSLGSNHCWLEAIEIAQCFDRRRVRIDDFALFNITAAAPYLISLYARVTTNNVGATRVQPSK